jgi:DNA-binding LytR/AlgR family response regulator
MKLNCLIVDDEPIAQQILEQYIEQIHSLHVVNKCNNAHEALNILHQTQIDILFLDIKMPSMSGLEMLKTLQNPPKVILTTAFSEFALESYEYGITDYLLKPIPFPRFLMAVNKILMPKNIDFPKENTVNKYGNEPTFIFFKADKKIHKFYFNEILFIEGCGNYVKIYSEKASPLMVLERLSDLEKNLQENQFLRVHKSFIVNITHIEQIEGNMLKIKDKTVAVSQSYKQNLEKLLNINK